MVKLSLLVLLTSALVQATPAHIYKNFPPSHKVKALAKKEKVPTEKPEQPAAVVATQTETPSVVTTAPVETPPAPVAPATSSCVTGYFTGDAQEDYIINHESGGNSCATNYLGCFGLMQACPGEPLRSACGGDPVCQLNWFWVNKVLPGYGSWAAVYNHEIAYGWW